MLYLVVRPLQLEVPMYFVVHKDKRMVDFANSNLCVASPEMNDVFKKLDELSEIESKIDVLQK